MPGRRHHHDWPHVTDVVGALLAGCVLVRLQQGDGRILSFVDAPDPIRHPMVNRVVHGATVGALLHRRWLAAVKVPAPPNARLPRTTYILNHRGRLLGSLQAQGLAPRE